jgi:hypothetical protein
VLQRLRSECDTIKADMKRHKLEHSMPSFAQFAHFLRLITPLFANSFFTFNRATESDTSGENIGD